LVERVVWDHEVAGSNPVTPTTTNKIKDTMKRLLILFVIVLIFGCSKSNTSPPPPQMPSEYYSNILCYGNPEKFEVEMFRGYVIKSRIIVQGYSANEFYVFRNDNQVINVVTPIGFCSAYNINDTIK
jgi:hypothetical protein